MKKQNAFAGYLLIGLGIYFLLRQLNIPYFSAFYSWPTILIIIGAAFLLHSYLTKDYSNIIAGVILLGLGLHFHSKDRYSFWIDHWAIYPMIVGFAFLLKYIKTKSGILPALVLLGLAGFGLFSTSNPSWFSFIYTLISWIEQFWPIVLVILGIYLLKKRS
ncbi:putative membrane protein YsxD [Halobacillus andaensis]|uniref:Membrane protein YsxD n=1 Tax=Halobacillus andaensis TaxID=1176239 RepID=A0A917AYB2_HALAA|nr:DUF5668 domain-containing protein [Halobacillus andaensis]MBP2002932.1 hypothetical protein [Halobacillus andaensis]GGF06692.1 putative membrane protein YsxD [Halobacillus andaensis]